MNLLLIVNPVAGKNRGEKALQRALPLLEKKRIHYDVKTSDFAGATVEIARQLDPSKYDGVIAVGGDGTLFEMLNGLLKSKPNLELPIGQIPVGTGNSFIKDLAIETIDDAIEKIAGGKHRKIDVGSFKYPEGEHYFINLLGTGFVSNVAHRAGRYKALGPLSYVLGVFGEVARLRSVPMELTVDGKVFTRDYIFAEICNSTKTGGNMIMAPEAKIDDGLLDVILLNNLSKVNLLKLFPQIFKGTHVADSHVESFRGKQIKIVTDVPQRLTPDGEVFGTTPIEVSILPQKVAMFC
ncbi:diacylglycerol kinase family lipid kinase [candidate division KSB1 bacterium]|nr:diacylglycerol kinase family lipid kinase [candidate division KSB1 bacterium]